MVVNHPSPRAFGWLLAPVFVLSIRFATVSAPSLVRLTCVGESWLCDIAPPLRCFVARSRKLRRPPRLPLRSPPMSDAPMPPLARARARTHGITQRCLPPSIVHAMVAHATVASSVCTPAMSCHSTVRYTPRGSPHPRAAPPIRGPSAPAGSDSLKVTVPLRAGALGAVGSDAEDGCLSADGIGPLALAGAVLERLLPLEEHLLLPASMLPRPNS